jgi:phage terminase small subunit
LKKVEVKNRLQELAKIAEDAKIADIKEMQQLLTEIIRQQMEEEIIVVEGCGEGCSEARKMKKKPATKDIINAINTLGKMQGAFNEKINLAIEPIVLKDDVNEDS